MDKLQFLIDWYNREEERKTAVESSLNIPIGILTFLFATQFYLIKEFDFENSSDLEKTFFLIFTIFSVTSSLVTGWYIFRSYHNFPKEYKYDATPYPTQLLTYEKDLIKYYEDNSSYFINVSGKDKFKEYLESKFAAHIDTNTFNNDEKYRFLNISKGFLMLSIVTILIALMPFLTNMFSKPVKPQLIEIVNMDSLNSRIENIEKNIRLNLRENEQRKTDTTTTTSFSTARQAN